MASATLGTAHTLDYVTFDVTSTVQDWIDGSWPNEGFVITPNGPGVRLEMESKESTGTSHPMELEPLDSGEGVIRALVVLQ